MVSWDMTVKFMGITPHTKELTQLAKQERFSNIEEMQRQEITPEGNGIYYLSVNNRATNQKEFKAEIIQ